MRLISVLLVLLVACVQTTNALERKGFVSVVSDCGVSNIGLDTTTALIDCITSIQPESVVHFDSGVYLVTESLPPVIGSHITLTSDAFGISRLKFTGCGDLLTFTNNNSTAFNSGVNNLWLHATRTDCTTRAIIVKDSSRFTVDNVDIQGFADGVSTYGREFFTLSNSKIMADRPIVIGKNANHPTLDSDHTLITRLYSIVTDPTQYHVTVDSGVSLTNISIDNAAMPKGSGIIKWLSTVDPGRASYHVKLSNIRHEQSQGDKTINIDITKPLYGLIIDNIRMEGPYSINATAINLNNVLGVTIKDTSYPNNKPATFLNVRNGDMVDIRNSFYYPSDAIKTTMTWKDGSYKTRNSERTTGLLVNSIQ